MANKNRIRLKYVYANKRTLKNDVIDIALLTIDNQYIEYTMSFKQTYLTMYVSKRIRSVFSDYIIDRNTDIALNDQITESHPLYQYFMILHQHIDFKFAIIDLNKIVNRINYYYTSKCCTKRNFNKVWNLIIENGQCPWIDANVDRMLQNYSIKAATRIKVVRMAMFYLIVKTHLYTSVKKSIAKKTLKNF